MKQTVFSATQAVPKPIVCAMPNAPAKAPLEFGATPGGKIILEKVKENGMLSPFEIAYQRVSA